MIACMEPVPSETIIREEGFIHQVKWDGIRGIAVVENGGVRLFNKSGIECTARYPELSALSNRLSAGKAILDGEIVALVDGKPSFYHALRRSMSGSAGAMRWPIRYIVFDILSLEGKDLRAKPLHERQRMLSARFSDSAFAAQTDSFYDGTALFDLMKQRNMEGIVSKRLSSGYCAGKTHSDWFKTKITRRILCAITGVNYKNGLPSSLSLGVYREGALTAAGDVGSGLKAQDLTLLSKELKPGSAPRITCWVRFSEWTPAGTLRNPVFLGFSDASPLLAMGEEQSV